MVLGPKRLPAVARALGKGMREFRESIKLDGAPTDAQATPEDHERHTP
jgi:Sec-independent protein translocase protein TatA